MDLQRVPVRILDMARESAALFEVLMEEKSIQLEAEGDGSTVVEGDPILLRQALVNVIHNAVKYSPVGGVIRLSVQRQGGLGIALGVQDQGPGIPEEDRSRVFERFYRVDKARWRESGGAGLGLAIAKWAVEANGGTIGISSTEHGALFVMRFAG